MENKKNKYFICILAILLITCSFYLSNHLSINTLNQNVKDYKDLITIHYYSFDGLNYYRYTDESLDMDNTHEDNIYFRATVNRNNNLNKVLVLSSINTNIKMYTTTDYFEGKNPITSTNNKIVTGKNDYIFFDLSDYIGDGLVFELNHVHNKNNIQLFSANSITQENLQKFIISFLQFQLFCVGISIACIFFIASIMLYKIFNQHHLNVILVLLIITLIMYISTTSYLSYFIYPNYIIWSLLQALGILCINIITYYYVSLIYRETVRKLAKTFLQIGMIFVILLIAIAVFVNQVSLIYNFQVILTLFTFLNSILIIQVLPDHINSLKKRHILENKIAMRKAPLSYILILTSFINLVILLYDIGLININTMNSIFFNIFLVSYILTVIFALGYLLVLRVEYDTIPDMLDRNNNLLQILNKQQIILYSKKTVEDIVLSIFNSAEELANQKVSGYYIIKEEDGTLRIVQGYGVFKGLTGKDYQDISIKDKYEYNKDWHVFDEAGVFDNIETKLCVLPSKSINRDDLLILNTFFSIAYEVVSNFILLQNMFKEEKELVYSLTEISEIRSKETGQHIKRVGMYCDIIARKYGLSEEEIELLVISSQMHDLGKLYIPDEILHKPAKLTNEEFDIVKTHAMAGYNILSNCTGKYLETSKIIARDHHEKYNGRGYYGKKGEDIDLYSRIVAIADVFDALTTKRAYKDPWEIERVIKLFNEERGEHFDPHLTDILLDSIDEFVEIMNNYA